MDVALYNQLRRELLVRLREEGGQASWRTLPMWEWEVLQKMEQEKFIEPVQSAEKPSTITYRIKPNDAEMEAKIESGL